MRFGLFFDKIVALSLMPILFIIFGIDDWSEDHADGDWRGSNGSCWIYNIAKSVPREQVVKAFALKSSNADVTAYRVVPLQDHAADYQQRQAQSKAAGRGAFLFAGEMLASTDGLLRYRIAIMRRHMGMDIIIPYLLWVAVLLFGMDALLRVANRRLHPWF